MPTYAELLAGIHGAGKTTEFIDADNKNIVINEKRQFVVPESFDTVIAYEGDVNNQIITFELPNSHEGHLLYECDTKQIRWKHLSSNIEGVSDLNVVSSGGSDLFIVTWEVPPEACISAGTLEVAIRIQDRTKTGSAPNITYGPVAFAWNSASYSGFSIGKTIDSVNYNFPPKNEILIIDKESKNIVAPAGYNNTICNYGEVGTANVHFLINRYLGTNKNFDVLNDQTKLAIYIVINGYRLVDDKNVTIIPYSATVDSKIDEGLAFISWEVPAQISSLYGACEFDIAIEFSVMEGEHYTKRWVTNTYSRLNIGNSTFLVDTPVGPISTFSTVFEKLIEDYFTEREAIWDSNLE